MYLLNKGMDATIQMPDIFFLQKTAPKQPLWNRQRLNRFYVFFFPRKMGRIQTTECSGIHVKVILDITEMTLTYTSKTYTQNVINIMKCGKPIILKFG